MKARFETKKALDERVLLMKPQATTLLYLGIVMFALAIIIGVTMMVTVKIVPGVILLVTFTAVGAFAVFMGAKGARVIVASNTLIADSVLKVTTIFDDRVEEMNECVAARDSRDIGYEYVLRAGFQSGMFFFELADGSYITALEDSLVDGNIDELREFLRSKFGAKYKEKIAKKKAKQPTDKGEKAIDIECDTEKIADDKTDNIDTFDIQNNGQDNQDK